MRSTSGSVRPVMERREEHLGRFCCWRNREVKSVRGILGIYFGEGTCVLLLWFFNLLAVESMILFAPTSF